MKTIYTAFMIVLFTILTPAGALAAKKHVVNLEFKMDYKRTDNDKKIEHEMKNEIILPGRGKWELAGKLQSAQNNNVTMLLARLLGRKDNKFTVQFMLIDSGAHGTYITEPKTTVLAGLPATLSVNENGRELEFSVLVITKSQQTEQ